MAKAYAVRPDTVTIGNHVFNIEWLTFGEWEARDHDLEKDGLTYAAKQYIAIRIIEGRAESLYQEVVLHEITHAAWDACGFSLKDNWHKQDEARDVEEDVILFQSPVMLRVLKDNPGLVKWLTSDGSMRR